MILRTQNTFAGMIVGMFLIIGLFISPVSGEDIRLIQIQTKQIQASLEQKAAAELLAAQNAAAKSRGEILENKATLKAAITKLKNQTQSLQQKIDSIDLENQRLFSQEADLSTKLAESDSMLKELTGVIRTNAKDIHGLVENNLQSAVFQADIASLDAISSQALFPGMNDIRKMTNLLFDQIAHAGSVSIETAKMVDRSGRQVEAQLLLMGCFTAAYRSGSEIGFLNYSPQEQKLYALSRLPSGHMQKMIKHYMAGQSQAVPMDISRGAALRQLSHELRLWEQIPNGGPIVWPILAILLIGGVIVMERVIFLLYRKMNVEDIFSRIEIAIAGQNWKTCQQTCEQHVKNPVIRVIKAGLLSRDLPREEIENTLQEAILKEIPPMERFLSTLGMLAAIAPLLGLLGTVTGMIDTFHVITMQGTGDPRLMSGGISEALVTTMLGLSVAIPIMLAHTLLSRAVENVIGLMEEKAVALVNMIQKYQGA